MLSLLSFSLSLFLSQQSCFLSFDYFSLPCIFEFFFFFLISFWLKCNTSCLYERLQLSGFKKVLNYTKKIMEDMRYRRSISREEVNILVQLVNLNSLIHLIGLQAINTAELEICFE